MAERPGDAADDDDDVQGRAPKRRKWEVDRDYPVVLGPSWKGAGLTTFRYEFMPKLVLTSADATMGIDGTQATIERPQRGGATATFTGQVADAAATDCVIVFDGEKFILEKVARCVQNIRVRRDEDFPAARRKDET